MSLTERFAIGASIFIVGITLFWAAVFIATWPRDPFYPTPVPRSVATPWIASTPTMQPFLPHGSPVAAWPRRPCPLVMCAPKGAYGPSGQ